MEFIPRPAIRAESIKDSTILQMQNLGVYKPEYNTIIDIYCEMREQYYRLTKKFVDSGFEFESFTAQGGAKKAPIVLTLESLRKDILAYSDRLCLNPKANDTVKIESPKGSRLEAALERLEKN